MVGKIISLYQMFHFVAISGLYKRSSFTLVLPNKNKKAVMLDDTIYFLSFDDVSDAIIVWAILNSEPIQNLLRSITFLDAKRPYTKSILMRIDLTKIVSDLEYNDIKNFVTVLEPSMLSYASENKWICLKNMLKSISSNKNQISLF